MNDWPTTQDAVQEEAATSVDRPLARVPLVLNRRNFSWITERISGVVEQPAPRCHHPRSNPAAFSASARTAVNGTVACRNLRVVSRSNS